MRAIRFVRVVCSVLAIAALSSACITGGPKRTTPELKDNGGPLEVRSSVVDTYTYSPGLQLSFKDGGQTEVFEGFYQGVDPVLDELDFYALAKDDARVARVVDWREKYNRTLFASYVGQGIGVAVVAAGLGVGAYGFMADPENVGVSPYYGAAIGLVIGGSILVGGAPTILWSLIGPETEIDRSNEKTPLVIPWREARDNVDGYNVARTGAAPAPMDAPADASADAPAADDAAAP